MKANPVFLISVLLLLCSKAWAVSDEARIRELLSGMQITHIQASPVTGWYEVQTPKTTFYVDKGARYALFGHLYDLVTRQDLTKKPSNVTSEEKNALHVDWASLPMPSAILNTLKKPIDFAVFLDPDCPYCRQVIKDLKTTSHAVAYYLMPLDELHPEASYKTQQILCSNKPYDSLLQVMAQDATLDVPVCKTPAMTRVQDFAKAHDFYGTPVFIRRDGAVHLGYLSPGELEPWLQQGV